MAWVFFVNKTYSPQYDLWIVVLLAVIGAVPVLAVAWSALDLLYFASGFIWLELWKYGDAQQWFGHYIFLPATALREVMLLVVAGWCIQQMSTSAWEPAQDSDEQPRGSPAGVV